MHTVALLGDIATGVQHLHQHGFVHRDLAARNMLVETVTEVPGGQRHLEFLGERRHVAKVGDFGQARKVPEGEDRVQFGLEVYDRNLMAPENWEMQPYHSVKSDVFQFGRVIWESCTYKFDEWFKYFTEGKGLLADPDTAECDPDQVTKSQPGLKLACSGPVGQVNGLREFGFILYQSGQEGSAAEEQRIQDLQGRVQLLKRVCADCLMHESKLRCTMGACAAALRDAGATTFLPTPRASAASYGVGEEIPDGIAMCEYGRNHPIISSSKDAEVVTSVVGI